MCIEEKATLHHLRVGPLTACVCSSAKQGTEVQSNNTTTTWRDLTRLVGRDLHCSMVNCGGRGKHVTFTIHHKHSCGRFMKESVREHDSLVRRLLPMYMYQHSFEMYQMWKLGEESRNKARNMVSVKNTVMLSSLLAHYHFELYNFEEVIEPFTWNCLRRCNMLGHQFWPKYSTVNLVESKDSSCHNSEY